MPGILHHNLRRVNIEFVGRNCRVKMGLPEPRALPWAMELHAFSVLLSQAEGLPFDSLG